MSWEQLGFQAWFCHQMHLFCGESHPYAADSTLVGRCVPHASIILMVENGKIHFTIYIVEFFRLAIGRAFSNHQ